MSDDWHFSHKNESGHDVNAYGYDKNGVYRGSTPFKNFEDNQIPKNKNKSNAAGCAGFFVLAFIVFIIIKVVEFLAKNWISVISILGIIISCVIFCLIIKRKLAHPRIATFLAILLSLGLI